MQFILTIFILAYVASPNVELHWVDNLGHGQPRLHFKTFPCAKTVTGNFYVPAGDTIEEDISISGGSAKIDGVVDGDLAVMGGEVDIKGLLDGDVAVFGGALDIIGKVTGDAAIFGGNINNKGKIEGDLLVVGGAAVLDSGSIINGDISMVGGTVERDSNASVLGEIESLDMKAIERIMPRIGRIGKAFRWGSPFRARTCGGFLTLFLIIVCYILNLLIILIFPKPVEKIIEKVSANVWIALATGIGIEILFIPLIALFAISLIGIPIIPVFVFAVFIAGLFGFSAISIIIGERIVKSLNWQLTGRVSIFNIGWLALMIIPILGLFLCSLGFIGSLIFVLGLVILYVTITIGLGGVVYAIVKRK